MNVIFNRKHNPSVLHQRDFFNTLKVLKKAHEIWAFLRNGEKDFDSLFI